jgi:anaerobic magnesium-protoporphyrin IX monomethyl ester cyclase
MRVALVQPEPTANVVINAPPLNLGYIAAYLREYNHCEVKIFDGVVNKNICKQIVRFHPNVVGVTATTPMAYDAYSLAEKIKVSIPDVLIVFGGVHASALPNEALPYFDCVVVGEGEKAFSEIVKQYPSFPSRIVYGEPVKDLDSIPSPAFDLLDIEKYLQARDNPGFYYPYGLDYVRTATIISSRGCPFDCVFCCNSKKRSAPRYHSAQRIIDEIKFYLEHYKVNSFFFLDDAFPANKKRMREFGRLLKKNNLKIRWGCQARTPILSEEYLNCLKGMGCMFVSPGFEHGNSRMLSYLKKGHVSIEQNHQALVNAEKAGVKIGGSFIFGSPTETKREMQDTLNFIRDHKQFVFVGVNVLIPYPGTEVWDYCKQNGLLPEVVDYRKLIPTSKAEDTYIVCNKLEPEKFRQLVMDAQRRSWVIAKTHLIKQSSNHALFDWLKKYRLPVWWWETVRHPIEMFHLFVEVLN